MFSLASSLLVAESSLEVVGQPQQVTVSTGALLVVVILTLVGVAAYRDERLATAIVAACAVGALLIAVLVT
ncbi:hypothetical protein GCM10010402_66260 [Actinomadura luteofluorescens]|nr:hypothetical protein [Actinomadura glauciflava]